MRKDSDNKSIIEQLRPKHAELMNRKIRMQADLDRAERDLEEHLAELRELAGTDDLDEIRKKVVANYEENTRLVDEFAQAHAEIAREVLELDGRA